MGGLVDQLGLGLLAVADRGVEPEHHAHRQHRGRGRGHQPVRRVRERHELGGHRERDQGGAEQQDPPAVRGGPGVRAGRGGDPPGLRVERGAAEQGVHHQQRGVQPVDLRPRGEHRQDDEQRVQQQGAGQAADQQPVGRAPAAGCHQQGQPEREQRHVAQRVGHGQHPGEVGAGVGQAGSHQQVPGQAAGHRGHRDHVQHQLADRAVVQVPAADHRAHAGDQQRVRAEPEHVRQPCGRPDARGVLLQPLHQVAGQPAGRPEGDQRPAAAGRAGAAGAAGPDGDHDRSQTDDVARRGGGHTGRHGRREGQQRAQRDQAPGCRHL